MKGLVSKLFLVVIVLATWTAAPSAYAQNAKTPSSPADTKAGHLFIQDAFLRTELYFGTERENFPPVTAEEFRGFLDAIITSRFPAGLTVFCADGQFQDDAGNTIKEKSFVLILLYPVKESKKGSRSIEFIRRAYKDAFQQHSVLRVDYPLPVQVSF